MPPHPPHADCGGERTGLYVRITVRPRGRRWVRVGTVCTRCQTVWPANPDLSIEDYLDRREGGRRSAA